MKRLIAIVGVLAVSSVAPASLARSAAPPAQIVFVRGGSDQIWVTSADGTRQRRLTSGIDAFPRWSPDHRWIAFTVAGYDRRFASQEIWLMHPDGSNRRQLTHLYPRQAIGLSWSPDGTQIAYSRAVKPPGGIWVINVDGSGSTAITNDTADSFPVWAPDGKHLLFTKECCSASGRQWNHPPTLFEIGANGNGEHRLLALPPRSCGDGHASWSPDSKWIAFSRCVYVGPSPDGEGPPPERSDVWLIRPNGTGLHRLVKNGQDPAWSRESPWIAFVRTAGNESFSSIYKIHPDGRGLVRVTRDPRGDRTPDW